MRNINDATLILLNTDMPDKLNNWLLKNDIHSYGSNPYGYLWVSWDGKLGNAVFTTEQLYDKFEKENNGKEKV